MISLQRVQDQTLVRLRDLRVREPPLIRQVHLRRDRQRLQTGRLCVQLEVDGFGGLDADDEFIPADVAEDTLGDVFELDTNLHLGFVQC